MNNLTLEKLQQLPPEKRQEVEDFVDYLLQKYTRTEDKVSSNELIEKRRQNLGRLKGKVWISEDFNETPEDFKEYI